MWGFNAMANPLTPYYKQETNRYHYYYHRLQVFYEKPAAQVSAAVLFTIALITFFAVFAIRPTLQTIAELLRKIDDQESVLSLAKKKSAALGTAQQQYDNVQPYMDTLDHALPAEYEVEELLKSIEGIAAQLQIPISNIRIGGIEYPVLHSKAGMKEINFNINLISTYPIARIFVNRLQQLPRLVGIESLTLAKDEQNKALTNPDSITVTIACKVYYSPEQE